MARTTTTIDVERLRHGWAEEPYRVAKLQDLRFTM
jgi:hypothetical protein